MHLQRLDFVVIALIFLAAAMLPVGTISSESTQLIVTFLGLVAASILPTVTLLLNSMTANGRSVKHLTELRDELGDGVGALFAIFLFVCAAVIFLAFYASPLPELSVTLPLDEFKIDISDLAKRIAQGGVAVFATLTVLGARVIPRTVQRALELRADIAVIEAERQTRENAPKAGDTAATFRAKENFGQTTSLQDLQDK